MTTALSIALMTLGVLSVFASVFSVLGHGITSRSPAREPFLLFVVGAAAIVAGLLLLGRWERPRRFDVRRRCLSGRHVIFSPQDEYGSTS